MTIDVVLISLQALLLNLYGMNGIVQSVAADKKHWIIILATFLVVIISSVFWGDLLRSNAQFFLLLVLALDYLLRVSGFSSTWWENTLVLGAMTFMSYTLVYFWWASPVVWVAVPLVFAALLGLINRWPDWFTNGQEYFLTAGALLTLLFAAEPVFVSVQQNLKPIATIPISSIINPQNFLLLGGLLVLVLGGFFWKEKSKS
ncbi:MAG: hypothetical protein ACFB15_02065 [Cyclobacteriaceae bacterium]